MLATTTISRTRPFVLWIGVCWDHFWSCPERETFLSYTFLFTILSASLESCRFGSWIFIPFIDTSSPSFLSTCCCCCGSFPSSQWSQLLLIIITSRIWFPSSTTQHSVVRKFNRAFIFWIPTYPFIIIIIIKEYETPTQAF